jgi:hypothetical protein
MPEPRRLSELLEADAAKRAKLRDTELIVLRLYSGKKIVRWQAIRLSCRFDFAASALFLAVQ